MTKLQAVAISIVVALVMAAVARGEVRSFALSDAGCLAMSQICQMEVASGTVELDSDTTTAKVVAVGEKDGFRWQILAYWWHGYFNVILFQPHQRTENGG